MDFIGESKNINQIDFMYELFKDFMESDEAKDFDFDNGLVCRWLNGTAKLSPKITAYYSALGNLEAMAIDIEENILPLFYDKDMAVTELYDLLMSDTTVSETKKQELADNYPYKDDADISNFISKLVFFGMERKFIKRDANTKKLIASGALSPQTKDYIYSLVPKPCKHFCGRDNELEKLHTMLEDENKIFIQGIAGIGKSEFVKMYAQKYKKEYTNILYFSYGGSLKQMITDCDFADDSLTDGKNILLKKHNRFLRSLKEDTLIIIDNFNITASDDELFDVIMKYRCKILFTTRSRFKDYTYFELKEMPLESLLTLSEYFYADTRSNTNVVENIINELHYHTLSVELAARLLTSGILEPCRLLTELQSTKSVLHTDDKINIVKDGTSSKATYYEHIHKLLSLIGLSDKAVKIMRCMTLIPYDGINPRMLAKWIGLNNLNTINELIEYGFIQENDYRKITLHPLIQEIAIDDTKPGISSCINLIEAVRILCLYHGLDLPYHTLLFKIAENTIDIANNDDTERYKLFLKDVFAYMEKYAYRSGMELIISELQSLVDTNEDKAILLDYKAAYEHICNKNHKKDAFHEYSNCLMDILEIKMPCISKDGKQFNITPPLLFRFQYIDQDEGWSKIADSFKNVAYIKDWKANTNKYVCGYLDDSYYALQAQKAEHILERDDKKKELNYNQNFVSRITSTLTRIEDIESVEDVTTDIELLLAKAEELRKLQFSYNAEMTVLENDIYINQHKLHIVEHNLIETKKDIEYAMTQEDELICPFCSTV